jgi:hypothetical protein
MAGDVLLFAWGGYRTCPVYLLKMYEDLAEQSIHQSWFNRQNFHNTMFARCLPKHQSLA